ncbi:transmembrane protein, putative (macronuclear) [Tetrahymena thermophila SB210]|uniref:Transmembrane protein, putative n=1 Tax=Tetrahymena thermophila (strain SB210) TaxID=312017 RepID=W7X851_TETTS|nr:transmembrane protein, putative [Tetrahymena thermophila SB210]EWS72593.1 transmembrane protein, putative [Tetrahymena thermophila SB210]|eukprot:XP_012654876.1 transmembrane protein, putative [Tetrahymena thermophila SB210]
MQIKMQKYIELQVKIKLLYSIVHMQLLFMIAIVHLLLQIIILAIQSLISQIQQKNFQYFNKILIQCCLMCRQSNFSTCILFNRQAKIKSLIRTQQLLKKISMFQFRQKLINFYYQTKIIKQ